MGRNGPVTNLIPRLFQQVALFLTSLHAFPLLSEIFAIIDVFTHPHLPILAPLILKQSFSICSPPFGPYGRYDATIVKGKGCSCFFDLMFLYGPWKFCSQEKPVVQLCTKCFKKLSKGGFEVLWAGDVKEREAGLAQFRKRLKRCPLEYKTTEWNLCF